MNILTALFLFLAAGSLMIPLPIPTIGGKSVCVKAYIGSRMFNKHISFSELPREGDAISTTASKALTVDHAQFGDRGSILLITKDCDGFISDEELKAAGFEELIRKDVK